MSNPCGRSPCSSPCSSSPRSSNIPKSNPCGCPPPPPPCGCPPRPSGCPPPPCGCPPRPSGCPPPPCGCPPRPSGCPPPPCGSPPRPCGCPPSKCGCPPPSGPGFLANLASVASYIIEWIFQKPPCEPCSPSTSTAASSSPFSDFTQWFSLDRIRSKSISAICKCFPKICPSQFLDYQPKDEPVCCLDKCKTAMSNFVYMGQTTKSVLLATVVFIGGVSIARRMRFIVESLNVV